MDHRLPPAQHRSPAFRGRDLGHRQQRGARLHGLAVEREQPLRCGWAGKHHRSRRRIDRKPVQQAVGQVRQPEDLDRLFLRFRRRCDRQPQSQLWQRLLFAQGARNRNRQRRGHAHSRGAGRGRRPRIRTRRRYPVPFRPRLAQAHPARAVRTRQLQLVRHRSPLRRQPATRFPLRADQWRRRAHRPARIRLETVGGRLAAIGRSRLQPARPSIPPVRTGPGWRVRPACLPARQWRCDRRSLRCQPQHFPFAIVHLVGAGHRRDGILDHRANRLRRQFAELQAAQRIFRRDLEAPRRFRHFGHAGQARQPAVLRRFSRLGVAQQRQPERRQQRTGPISELQRRDRGEQDLRRMGLAQARSPQSVVRGFHRLVSASRRRRSAR